MKQTILTALIIVLAGCAPDTSFNTTTKLEGIYKGTYEVIKDYNTNSPASDKDNIEWVFAGKKFWCYFRPLQGESPLTCNFFGSFEIESSVVLKDTTVIGQCNHSYIAIEGFSMTSRNDSLFLEREYRNYDPPLKIRVSLQKDTTVIVEQ